MKRDKSEVDLGVEYRKMSQACFRRIECSTNTNGEVVTARPVRSPRLTPPLTNLTSSLVSRHFVLPHMDV